VHRFIPAVLLLAVVIIVQEDVVIIVQEDIFNSCVSATPKDDDQLLDEGVKLLSFKLEHIVHRFIPAVLVQEDLVYIVQEDIFDSCVSTTPKDDDQLLDEGVKLLSFKLKHIVHRFFPTVLV
jgi:hypothetical protein